MAVYEQQVNTYDDTTPHVRVISNIINMIDPRDTPVVARLGLDSARSKFKIGLNGYKIEILEDELDPLSGTSNQGTTLATDGTTLTVTDGSIYQAGHVIKIDDELIVVKSVSGDILTFHNRTYGGTNATHALNAAIEIVGMARVEGADVSYGPIVDITAPFNYTSIYEKALDISGTMQAIAQYGITDEMQYQANKAIPHLMRLIEKGFFHGIRDAGSATLPRSAGGIEQYVTDNSVSITIALVKSDIDQLAELIVLDGGNPDMLIVAPQTANNIRGLIDSSSFVRTDQENTMFGMRGITRINTQFYGDLELLTSRWCPPDKAYMLESGKVGFYTLRPFGFHDIAKSGDSFKKEVVGEFSLMVANDQAHGWALTTASEL